MKSLKNEKAEKSTYVLEFSDREKLPKPLSKKCMAAVFFMKTR